jgi:hypothetical protein
MTLKLEIGETERNDVNETAAKYYPPGKQMRRTMSCLPMSLSAGNRVDIYHEPRSKPSKLPQKQVARTAEQVQSASVTSGEYHVFHWSFDHQARDGERNGLILKPVKRDSNNRRNRISADPSLFL